MTRDELVNCGRVMRELLTEWDADTLTLVRLLAEATLKVEVVSDES